MRTVEGINYLTIGEVSKIIGRGTQTIKNWYEWQELNGSTEEQLPEIFYLDQKRTRYFKESDIPLLEKFRDSIKYGMMAELNREKWGVRGQIDEAQN